MTFEKELKIAIGELNLTTDYFWSLTPAEFYVIYKGNVRQQRQRQNELIYTAWTTAMLSRQPTMPSLDSLLIDEEQPEPKKQTDEQMLSLVKMLNAAYGGEVVEVCE